MRTSSSRKVVLPDGELSRFRLPEAADERNEQVRPRRRAIWRWGLLWLAVTFLCFQWSEGRLGPQQWLSSVLRWLPTEPPAPIPQTPSFRPSEPRANDRRSEREQAAIALAPSAPAERPAELPVHEGSFEHRAEALEAFGSFPSTGIHWTHTDLDTEVHAGPGCERAKRRYSESFLDESAEPRILGLLRERERYGHCKAELMSLRICALVHKGEAIGVTVQSEPPSRIVSTCAAIVAKTLHYPKLKRPQLVRAELYFQ